MSRKSLRICRELGDVQHTLDGLSRIAGSLAQAGCARQAAPLLSSSLALHEEIRMNVPPYQQRRNDATLALLHGQLDEAAFAEAWEEGRALTLDEAVALALESLD